jgi:hypothetical protein
MLKMPKADSLLTLIAISCEEMVELLLKGPKSANLLAELCLKISLPRK